LSSRQAAQKNPVIDIPIAHYEKLTDDDSEEWLQRFWEERQEGWQNKGW